MAELIITGDVEGAAITYLTAGLTAQGITADVSVQVPDVMPAKMVRVSLTGGSRANMVTDRPQLTVECWAGSTVDASELARVCQGLMHAAGGTSVGDIWVRKVEEVGGVQFLPDPDTNSPRYLFTVRWHVRGTAF